MMTLDELMVKVSETLDPEEIVDLLHLTSKEIVEAFDEKIAEDYERIINDLSIEQDDQDNQGGISGYDYYV